MEDHNSPEAVAKRASQEDPIVMYLIVRESLNMSIGKTSAQTAHASQMLQLRYDKVKDSVNWTLVAHGDLYEKVLSERVLIFQEWLNTSFRKVVLKADDKEWYKVQGCFVEDVTKITVVDAGLTEIASGSETVIGLWPMRKSERPKILQKLQALK